MTEDEKNKVILDLMVLHAGKELKGSPLSHLTPKDVWTWIDKMNKVLVDTPFFYVLTADGVKVMLREWAKSFARAMFDKPMEGYKT